MIKTEIFKLDRIEDDKAVLESPEGEMIFFSPKILPENAKSGDCFVFEDGKFLFAEETTKSRRKKISKLLESIITEKN